MQTLIDGTDTKALRQVVKEVKQASADDEKEKAERKKRLKSQMSTLMAPVSLGFEEDDISQKADKEDKPKNPASADKKPKPQDKVPEDKDWAIVGKELGAQQKKEKKHEMTTSELMRASLGLHDAPKKSPDEEEMEAQEEIEEEERAKKRKKERKKMELVAVQTQLQAKAAMKMKMATMRTTHGVRHAQYMQKAMDAGATFEEAHKMAMIADGDRLAKAAKMKKLDAHPHMLTGNLLSHAVSHAMQHHSPDSAPGTKNPKDQKHQQQPPTQMQAEAKAKKPVQRVSAHIFSSTSKVASDENKRAAAAVKKLADDLFNPPPLPPPHVDPVDANTNIISETLSALSDHHDVPIEDVTKSLPTVLATAKEESAAAQEADIKALSPSALVRKLRHAGMEAQAASLERALAEQQNNAAQATPETLMDASILEDDVTEEMPPISHRVVQVGGQKAETVKDDHGDQKNLVKRLRAAGMQAEADHIEGLLQITTGN